MVVPAFNEGPELAHNVDTLLRFLQNAGCAYDFEILIIDDGSTDETYNAALTCAQRHPQVRVVRHVANRGLGCAIRSGFAFARGAVAVVYDSDLSYDPEIVPRLLAQMDANADDLVLASPYMRGGRVTNVPFLRRFLSREANRFLSFATNGRYATLTCMVRAYRLSFFKDLQSTQERMEINPELAFKALKRGARVSEIPAVLSWTGERARARGRVNPARTAKQIAATMRVGVAHRPAILLALPGILPGVLPLIVAITVLLHLSLPTIAAITVVTMVIQNTSLAFFAGQLAVFGRNVIRAPGLDRSR